MTDDPSEIGLSALQTAENSISERSSVSEHVDDARFVEAEGSWDAENVSEWEYRENFGQY